MKSWNESNRVAAGDWPHKALISMEACPGSPWLARRLASMGHAARITPVRLVTLCVKSNKTDIVDAAAITVIVMRPTIWFPAGDARIAVRALCPRADDRAARSSGACDRIRDWLVGQRTMLGNLLCAFSIKDGLTMCVARVASTPIFVGIFLKQWTI